jgi:hypothetical protein
MTIHNCSTPRAENAASIGFSGTPQSETALAKPTEPIINPATGKPLTAAEQAELDALIAQIKQEAAKLSKDSFTKSSPV